MIKGLLSKYESTEAGHTVTLKCNEEQGASILSLHKKEVAIDELGIIHQNRAAILSNIRSLAEQVADAISRELEPPAIMPDSVDLFEQVTGIAYQKEIMK